MIIKLPFRSSCEPKYDETSATNGLFAKQTSSQTNKAFKTYLSAIPGERWLLLGFRPFVHLVEFKSDTQILVVVVVAAN